MDHCRGRGRIVRATGAKALQGQSVKWFAPWAVCRREWTATVRGLRQGYRAPPCASRMSLNTFATIRFSSARRRQNQRRGSCSRIACIASCVGDDKKLCNVVRLLAAAFLECTQSALALQCLLQLEQSRNVSKYGPARHATRSYHSAAFPCHCDAGFDQYRHDAWNRPCLSAFETS